MEPPATNTTSENARCAPMLCNGSWRCGRRSSNLMCDRRTRCLNSALVQAGTWAASAALAGLAATPLKWSRNAWPRWALNSFRTSARCRTRRRIVAICHHTLEHLLAPAEALLQLARILKPQGKLVLHVPWERERRYARHRADEPNHHLYDWNAQNLGNLVTVLKFRIQSVVVRRYGYDRFAANLAARLRAGERGFRIIRAGMIALRPLREVELIATHAVSHSS